MEDSLLRPFLVGLFLTMIIPSLTIWAVDFYKEGINRLRRTQQDGR